MAEPATNHILFGGLDFNEGGIAFVIFSIKYNGEMKTTVESFHVKSKNPYMAFDRIPVKFRKCNAKNVSEATKKIIEFLSKVEDFYANYKD